MAKVHFKGAEVNTNGTLPKVGAKSPDFVLTNADLQDKTLQDFKGKRTLISVVPSLDTGVCALSAKKFNELAKAHPEVVFITVSCDLPFAQKRFCQAEGVHNVLTLSMLRSKDFAAKFGVLLVDGPLAGLASRSIFVLDAANTIVYCQLVDEVTNEPNYDEAFQALLQK